MNCILCQKFLGRKFNTFMNHIDGDHGVKQNQRLVLSLFLLNTTETEEFSVKTKTRFDEFKNYGLLPGQSDTILLSKENIKTEDENELNEIQSQLDFDISSDEEEENSEKEEDDEIQIIEVKNGEITNYPRAMTVIKTDIEELMKESEDEMEKDEETSHESLGYGESDSTEVVKDLTKINLVEKFKSLTMCRLCYRKFSSVSNLERHEKVVHKDDERELNLSHFTITDLVHPCDKCPNGDSFVMFLTEKILNVHRELDHGIKNKAKSEKECKLCYLKFGNIHYLQKHQKNVHKYEAHLFLRTLTDSEKVISCNGCDLKFVSENSQKHHAKKSHSVITGKVGTSSLNLKCYFCDERFSNGLLRKEHCLSYHDKQDEIVDQSRVRCMICSKVVNKSNIYTHRKTHDPSASKCKLCHCSFSSNGNKKKHELDLHKTKEERLFLSTGEGELKVQCGECDKLILNEEVLKLHLARVHKIRKKRFKKKIVRRLKSLQCKLCYKILSSSAILIHHQKVMHQEEREYFGRDITEQDLKHPCLSEGCSLRFVSSALLKTHMKKHELENFEFLRAECFDSSSQNFSCPLCHSLFSSHSTLVSHLTSYHREELDYVKVRPLQEELSQQCPDCELRFISENSLAYHSLKYHHMEKEGANCSLCELSFKNYIATFTHKLHVHKDELSAFSKRFTEKEKRKVCELCDKRFFTEGSLHSHRRKAHMKMTKNHQLKVRSKKRLLLKKIKKKSECQLCYVKVGYLPLHLQKVHRGEEEFWNREFTPDELVYDCDKCDLKFVSAHSLQFHKSRHDLTYTCFFCPETLTGTSSLLSHCLEVHDKKEERLATGETKCMVCLRPVKTISEHRKTHTAGLYECKLCHFKFKQKSVRATHIKNTHRSEEEQRYLREGTPDQLRFPCPTCSLRFLTENLRARHEAAAHNSPARSVARERLTVPCNLCYVEFRRPAQLKEHRERIHTTEEEKSTFYIEEIKASLLSHQCKFCDKKFFSKNALSYHRQLRHKEETRRDNDYEISCEFCSKVFKWKNRGNFKKHIKTIHNIDDYDIDDLGSSTDNSASKTADNFLNFLNIL